MGISGRLCKREADDDRHAIIRAAAGCRLGLIVGLLMTLSMEANMSACGLALAKKRPFSTRIALPAALLSLGAFAGPAQAQTAQQAQQAQQFQQAQQSDANAPHQNFYNETGLATDTLSSPAPRVDVPGSLQRFIDRSKLAGVSSRCAQPSNPADHKTPKAAESASAPSGRCS
jgi:hypothetical protein